MPLVGDIRVDPKYGPDTPIDEIYEFEIWDGQKWLPAATAKDILYNIGSGAGDGLSKSFREIKQEIKNDVQ